MNGVKRRVARGVKLLDKRMPGWDNRIDLYRLDMEDYRHCVLGQLYGAYHRGIYSLFGQKARRLYVIGTVYGFTMYFSSEFGPLDEEWTRVITDRRIAAAERFIKDEKMDRLKAWANA